MTKIYFVWHAARKLQKSCYKEKLKIYYDDKMMLTEETGHEYKAS